MIDPRTFRNVLGRFATGVCVVAIGIDEGVHAMTANAVCALSLEPPQVLFCPNKSGRLAQLVPRAERFSVSFLREEQQALSTYFAGGWKEPQPPPYRFVQDNGAPRLEGSLAALVCEKHAVHDGGDHLLVIGRVLAVHQGLEPHHPLLFFKGKYQSMERTGGKEAPLLADVTDEPPTVYYH
jgi:3-hydroxy-9,10-secoandrosta-1,3,5(10)-triene-9,17-dione monooxygenase reductase component